MRTKVIFALIMIFGIVITGCKQKEEKDEIKVVNIDLVNDEFPEAKQEVKLVLDSLFVSIQNREIKELLSYHLYSDKFTEFRDGLPRTGSSENEINTFKVGIKPKS